MSKATEPTTKNTKTQNLFCVDQLFPCVELPCSMDDIPRTIKLKIMIYSFSHRISIANVFLDRIGTLNLLDHVSYAFYDKLDIYVENYKFKTRPGHLSRTCETLF